jgi:Ca2+-binding EF-hand superfamily protein
MPVTVDNTLCARKKYLGMTPEERQMLGEVLVEFQKEIQIRRLDLKNTFMDFDITQNQHVTKYQFLRTLAMNGLQCKEEVMNMILKHYCDKGNADEVNYFDFCNDVDSPELIFGVGRGFNHSFDYYPKTKPRITGIDIKKDVPDDVEDALAKLRQFCKEHRIRIGEFFRDFDKLRSGFITHAQFRIGLNMAKVVLSGSEFNLLCNHFAAPDDNKVRWRDFCDSVEEVFYKKGMEKNVDMSVDDARTVSFYGQAQPNDNDHVLVEQVRAMFHEQVVRERLNAKSFF